MKTLLIITAASAAFAFPALAQTQTPATPPAHQQNPSMMQTQPMQGQAAAINPSTLSRRQIQQVQQALDKDGFGAGRTDGMWGPETKTALEKFQKSKNMGTANGQLDDATLSALQLNPSEFAQGQGMKGANGNMAAPQQAKQAPATTGNNPPAPPAKTP